MMNMKPCIIQEQVCTDIRDSNKALYQSGEVEVYIELNMQIFFLFLQQGTSNNAYSIFMGYDLLTNTISFC